MVVLEVVVLILLILLFAPLMILLILRQFTRTPYGNLDIRVALILRIMNIFKRFHLRTDKPAEWNRKNADRNAFLGQGRKERVLRVEDSLVDGPGGKLALRIYTPSEQKDLPILLFFHGGGMVYGNVDTHDGICRSFSRRANAVVISVDYRLAPENTFPAGIEDAYSALTWVSENSGSLHGNGGKITVAGDSAGGSMAAAVSQMARDRNGPEIAYQILIYPGTDIASMDTDTYSRFEEGFMLTRRAMEWLRSQYLPDKKDWTNPYASPLLAESLQDLPPALIVTAEFDVLRDEGEAYAHKLVEAGVPCEHMCYPGVIHGFISMSRFLPQAARAIQMMADKMNAVLVSRGLDE